MVDYAAEALIVAAEASQTKGGGALHEEDATVVAVVAQGGVEIGVAVVAREGIEIGAVIEAASGGIEVKIGHAEIAVGIEGGAEVGVLGGEAVPMTTRVDDAVIVQVL